MLKDIAQHYISKLITSPDYNNPNGVRSTDLLVPAFYELVKKAIAEFNKEYSDVGVVFVETYRSNALQRVHYNNGASQIKENGMHHYGIAVDCFFKINGKNTYNGDYKYLRRCFFNAGLFLIGTIDKSWDLGHTQFIPATKIKQNELRAAVLQAVKDFQRDNGLVADGIVGKKTIAKAKEVFNV